MSFNGDLYPTAGADVVMTTKGDMVDYNTSRQRLGIGSTNQILQVKSGLPSWETLSTAGSVLTTQGDILYEGASGLARLGQSTDGFVLTTKGAGADPVWASAGGGNVDILGDTELSGTATNMELLFTAVMPDDYSFIRVILGGDTDGSADLDFTLKSDGSYLSEYHQMYYNNLLGTGSSGSDTSAFTLELQSTAEINVARNVQAIIDITLMNATASQYTWSMSGICGCVNRSLRTFTCGTANTGDSGGADLDGVKVALSANNFEALSQMTALGFKR